MAIDGGMIQAIAGAGQAIKQQQLGLIQSAIGFFGGRRARRALENQPLPTYSPVKSITDYYNEAQRRYQENPYQSNLYKMQAQNIARGTAQGIAGLQDRRSSLAGISGLIQGQNDALLKAAAIAEQQKDQRFGQLGAATQGMAAEQRKEWEVNQMLPYQTKRELLGQKAAGYAQMLNAGLTNYFGGGQTGAIAASGLSGDLNSYGNRRSIQQPTTQSYPPLYNEF